MDIKDLLKDVGELSDKEFERQLHKLVRENYRFRNLDSDNQKVILDLVKKYKGRIRLGQGIPEYTIRHKTYALWKNREKLGLTEEDLKDIKEILKELKG